MIQFRQRSIFIWWVWVLSGVITSNYSFALSFRSQTLTPARRSILHKYMTRRSSNWSTFEYTQTEQMNWKSGEYVSSIQIACPAIADVCASCSMSCIIYSIRVEISINWLSMCILSFWVVLHDTRLLFANANFLATFTNKVTVDDCCLSTLIVCDELFFRRKSFQSSPLQLGWWTGSKSFPDKNG